MGASQATVSYLENGKVDAHILTLQKWARAYGHNVEIHFVPIEDDFTKELTVALSELEEESRA